MTEPRAGCNHFGNLVSEPMTAANQNPEHRCADCDAVVIPGNPAMRRDQEAERVE